MFKQIWANYVKNFAENPEYCAKVSLVVCGCMGGAVGAAMHWYDKYKELKKVISLQKAENNFYNEMIKLRQEEK